MGIEQTVLIFFLLNYTVGLKQWDYKSENVNSRKWTAEHMKPFFFSYAFKNITRIIKLY